MDPACALLDREIMISGILHDMNGRLMVLQWFAHAIDEWRERIPDAFRPIGDPVPAIEQLTRLGGALSDTAVGPPGEAVFRGVPVRVRGPIEVLEVALSGLPSVAVQVEVMPDHVVLSVTGVPAAEATMGWSFSDVERWRAQGGPGLAGARLQIAARLVGATRCFFPVPVTGPTTSFLLHLAR